MLEITNNKFEKINIKLFLTNINLEVKYER
jgi:hypothetical protein